MFGFGKNKNKSYSVMHYEGIPGIATNMPCSFEIINDILTIHLNKDSDVTLPLDRVIKFESM